MKRAKLGLLEVCQFQAEITKQNTNDEISDHDIWCNSKPFALNNSKVNIKTAPIETVSTVAEQ